MLNYKNTNLFIALFLVIVLSAHQWMQVSWWWMALLIVVYILILIYGSVYIGSDFYMPVVCKVVTEKKQIALTFDDGPVEKNTSLVLDVLKRNNIPAAFFCIGKRMDENKSLSKRIEEEGHVIGNHSYSHNFFFDFFSTKRMVDELERTNKIAEQTIGKKLKLFRPPYGVTTPNLARAVKKNNYSTIGWSVRTMDTVARNKKELLTKITGNIKPGDVILFHDTVDVTTLALQSFIDQVKQQGYELVRLDKLLNIEAYA